MAENENLSAKIEIGVEIDQASLKKAQADIAAIQADSDIAIKNSSKIKQIARPASLTSDAAIIQIGKNSKKVAQVLDALVNEAETTVSELSALSSSLKRAGYKLEIDAATGQVSVRNRESAIPTYQDKKDNQKAVKNASYTSNSNNNQYIASGQLSPAGPDAQALKKAFLQELQNMGFTGELKNVMIGGYRIAEEQTANASKTYLRQLKNEFDGDNSDEEFAMEMIDSVTGLKDTYYTEAASWMNSENERLAKIMGIPFAKDATTGQGKDFALHEGVVNHLRYGERLPKHYKKAFQDKAIFQDFIPGADNTPIISGQTAQIAMQRAMAKLGPAPERQQIAEEARLEAERNVEDYLVRVFGLDFTDITQTVNKSFKDFDWLKTIKKAKESVPDYEEVDTKELELLEDKELEAQGQKISKGLFTKLMRSYTNQTGKKAIGADFHKWINESIGKYQQWVTVKILDDAYNASENAIGDHMSDFGNLAIGDSSGALNNAQEYPIRAAINSASRNEARFGLVPGAVATHTNAVLAEKPEAIDLVKGLVATLKETNLPQSPYFNQGGTNQTNAHASEFFSQDANINRFLRWATGSTPNTSLHYATGTESYDAATTPRSNDKKIANNARRAREKAVVLVNDGNDVAAMLDDVVETTRTSLTSLRKQLKTQIEKLKKQYAAEGKVFTAGDEVLATAIDPNLKRVRAGLDKAKASGLDTPDNREFISEAIRVAELLKVEVENAKASVAANAAVAKATTQIQAIPDDSAVIAQAKAEAQAKEAARLAAVTKAKAEAKAARIAQTPAAANPVRSASDLPSGPAQVVKKELLDIQIAVDEFLKESKKAGAEVKAALDTEYFAPKDGSAAPITESSLVLKNSLGKILDLQTMMHRPAYLDQASGVTTGEFSRQLGVQGLDGIGAFEKRAQSLNIAASELGDLKDVNKNAAELAAKLELLSGIIAKLNAENISVTGYNHNSADKSAIFRSIDYVGSKGYDVPKNFPVTEDNYAILKNLKKRQDVTDPGAVFARSTADLKQGTVLKALFDQFPQMMAKYSQIIAPNQEGNGFNVTIDNQTLPAHTAKADAIASLIINEVLKELSPMFAKAAANLEVPIANTRKTSGKKSTPQQIADNYDAAQAESNQAMSNAKIQEKVSNPAFAEANRREAIAATIRLYDAVRKATIANNKEDLVSEEIAKKAVSSLELIIGLSQKRIDLLKSKKPGELSSKDAAELDRYNKLIQTHALLTYQDTKAGMKYIEVFNNLRKANVAANEEQMKINKEKAAPTNIDKYHATLSEGIQATSDRNGAGSVFGKQIQAQMKDYVAKEKEVENANKSLINTWVTARYALYDVGNAFQGVSRQLLNVSREIFNLTNSYRSFETAFMPVDRAMGLMKDETQGVLDQFIKLSEQVPVTVEDLSRIATLGAQMGVGASGIVDFTQTVAQFTAITGMSADTVAEKFGRIAQLTKLDYSQLANLGSSIAYAGVNAVATEPEIMSLAESIAAVSQRVGVLPEQVIGLATSLASLGVPAEQARGVFTRLFGKIDRVVADGGPALQKFAKTAGVSADEFSSKWGEAGQSYDLIRGILGGVEASGKKLTAVFDSLGITETREVNTLTRMAKNLDVVDKSMSDASKAFASNIFLQEAFAKTADTVDSKLKLFQNSLNSFGAEVGKTLAGGFKAVLEVMTGFMQSLKGLAQDPAMQVFATVLTSISALGAVGAGAIAIMSKITAQIYAFRVAMINTANDPTATAGIGRQLQSLLNYKTELVELRSGLSGANPNARGKIEPINYSLNTRGDDASKKAALLRDRNLYRATGQEMVQQLQAEAVAQNDLATAKELGSLSSNKMLMFARKEADAVTQIVKVRQAEISTLESEIAQKVASGEITQANATATIASARSKQILVATINGEVRALTEEEILNAKGIATSGTLTAAKQAEAAARVKSATAITVETEAVAASNKNAFSGVGSKLLGFAGWVGIAATVLTTVYGIVEGLIKANQEAQKFDILGSGGGVASLRDAINKDTVIYEKTGKAIGTVKVKYDDYTASLSKSSKEIQKATGIKLVVNNATGALTSTIKTQTMALGENSKAWLANAIATNEKVKAVFDANPNLLNDLKKQGIDFAKILNDMLDPDIKNPEKPIDDAIAAVKAKMDKLQDEMNGPNAPTGSEATLQMGKYRDQVAQLVKVKNLVLDIGTAIDSATSQSAFNDMISGLLGLSDAADEADNSLTNVAKTVKSARDWASEIAGVWSEAFANRFGRQQGLDAINKQWIDMRKSVTGAKKAITEANKAIDDARASIQRINADKGVLEMQLQVAIRYGDTVRADVIRAKLGEANKQLDDAQTTIDSQGNTIKENEKTLNKGLTGKSEVAINNRSQVLGMIQGYDPYIQAILSTSKNADEAKKKIGTLRESFMKNGEALGFDPKELETYAKHFDSMSIVLEKLPRDVTIEFNGDPALAAIRSFVEKANDLLDGGDDSTKKKLIKQTLISLRTKLAERQTFFDSITGTDTWSQKGKGEVGRQISGISSTITRLEKEYKKMATGGFVQGAGSGTSDSIPTMLSNGEYVITAQSVSRYGLDFMNSLNQQRVGYAQPTQQYGSSSSNDPQMVYLSPDDRALLRAAIDRPVNLYTENAKIAQSANAGNVMLARRGTN